MSEKTKCTIVDVARAASTSQQSNITVTSGSDYPISAQQQKKSDAGGAGSQL